MKVYNLPKSVRPSEPAVWLQEIGWVEAKPAKDLVVGEKRAFNTGVTYFIERVDKVAGWIHLSLSTVHGQHYFEKKRPNTLVPFEKSQEQITEEVRQNLIKGASNGL